MKTEFIQWLIDHNAEYQVRYADYDEGVFTLPSLLTEDRADKLYDLSIVEIRFTL